MSLGSGEWSIVILIGQEKRTSHPKEDERIFTISKSYLHHEMNRGSKISGVKRIRVYDLRHPYVKHTTKKFNSEKQKTQATKIVDLIAWVFCFCIVSYSKRSWTL